MFLFSYLFLIKLIPLESLRYFFTYLLICLNCIVSINLTTFVMNLFRGTGSQYMNQIESDAARYRAERNNARLQVKEMSDKLNW